MAVLGELFPEFVLDLLDLDEISFKLMLEL